MFCMVASCISAPAMHPFADTAFGWPPMCRPPGHAQCDFGETGAITCHGWLLHFGPWVALGVFLRYAVLAYSCVK